MTKTDNYHLLIIEQHFSSKPKYISEMPNEEKSELLVR